MVVVTVAEVEGVAFPVGKGEDVAVVEVPVCSADTSTPLGIGNDGPDSSRFGGTCR